MVWPKLFSMVKASMMSRYFSATVTSLWFRRSRSRETRRLALVEQEGDVCVDHAVEHVHHLPHQRHDLALDHRHAVDLALELRALVVLRGHELLELSL